MKKFLFETLDVIGRILIIVIASVAMVWYAEFLDPLWFTGFNRSGLPMELSGLGYLGLTLLWVLLLRKTAVDCKALTPMIDRVVFSAMISPLFFILGIIDTSVEAASAFASSVSLVFILLAVVVPRHIQEWFAPPPLEELPKTP